MGAAALTSAAFALLALVCCQAAGWLLKARRAADISFALKMSSAHGRARAEWERAVEAMAARGALDGELRRIAEAGGVAVPKCAPAAKEARWEFSGHARAKASIAAAAALAGWLCAASGLGGHYVAWAAAGVACATVIAICDVRAQVIPWEPLLVMAGAGVYFAFADGRPDSLAATFALAAATFAASKCVSVLGREGALGNGDVRAATACVCFLGAGPVGGALPLAAGALAASALGLAWLAGAALAGKASPASSVSLGPAFGACAAIGAIAPAVTALAI